MSDTTPDTESVFATAKPVPTSELRDDTETRSSETTPTREEAPSSGVPRRPTGSTSRTGVAPWHLSLTLGVVIALVGGVLLWLQSPVLALIVGGALVLLVGLVLALWHLFGRPRNAQAARQRFSRQAPGGGSPSGGGRRPGGSTGRRDAAPGEPRARGRRPTADSQPRGRNRDRETPRGTQPRGVERTRQAPVPPRGTAPRGGPRQPPPGRRPSGTGPVNGSTAPGGRSPNGGRQPGGRRDQQAAFGGPSGAPLGPRNQPVKPVKDPTATGEVRTCVRGARGLTDPPTGDKEPKSTGTKPVETTAPLPVRTVREPRWRRIRGKIPVSGKSAGTAPTAPSVKIRRRGGVEPAVEWPNVDLDRYPPVEAHALPRITTQRRAVKLRPQTRGGEPQWPTEDPDTPKAPTIPPQRDRRSDVSATDLITRAGRSDRWNSGAQAALKTAADKEEQANEFLAAAGDCDGRENMTQEQQEFHDAARRAAYDAQVYHGMAALWARLGKH